MLMSNVQGMDGKLIMIWYKNFFAILSSSPVFHDRKKCKEVARFLSDDH